LSKYIIADRQKATDRALYARRVGGQALRKLAALHPCTMLRVRHGSEPCGSSRQADASGLGRRVPSASTGPDHRLQPPKVCKIAIDEKRKRITNNAIHHTINHSSTEITP
jgi:hypothetical protein